MSSDLQPVVVVRESQEGGAVAATGAIGAGLLVTAALFALLKGALSSRRGPRGATSKANRRSVVEA